MFQVFHACSCLFMLVDSCSWLFISHHMCCNINREASASNTKVRTDWSSNLDALEILTLSREQVEAQ